MVQTCSKWSEIVHIGLDKFSVQLIFLGCRNRGCKGQGWCRICHSLHGLRSCPIHRFANEGQVRKRGMFLFSFLNSFIYLKCHIVTGSKRHGAKKSHNFFFLMLNFYSFKKKSDLKVVPFRSFATFFKTSLNFADKNWKICIYF